MSSPAESRTVAAAEAPRPRFQLAIRLLAAATILTTAGQAAATWRGDGSSINSFLFLALGLSHEAAAAIERAAMGTVLAAATCGAIWPRWFLLVPVSVYFLAESLAGWHQGGYPFNEWSPVARAPTYIVPLALALVASRKAIEGTARITVASWALRGAAAAVFLAHGLEAFYLHPRFIDLILTSSLNLFDLRIAESTAGTLLRVIGVLDIAVALAILIRPWRAVLVWMAFWAAVAAASRFTAHGWGVYPDLLLRASFVAAPLAVWALRAPNRGAGKSLKVSEPR